MRQAIPVGWGGGGGGDFAEAFRVVYLPGHASTVALSGHGPELA